MIRAQPLPNLCAPPLRTLRTKTQFMIAVRKRSIQEVSHGSFLDLVQLTESAIGVEGRRRECVRELQRFVHAEHIETECFASEDRQPVPARDDFSARAALRSFRPRAVEFTQVEKVRHDFADVTPIAGIVRLQQQFAAGQERPMCQREELRRRLRDA